MGGRSVVAAIACMALRFSEIHLTLCYGTLVPRDSPGAPAQKARRFVISASPRRCGRAAPETGPLAFAVWIKALFTAFLPGGLELRLGDVPVGPAFLEHRPQILAQL